MESPIQNLRQICQGILAKENQYIVRAASDRISVWEMKGKMWKNSRGKTSVNTILNFLRQDLIKISFKEDERRRGRPER